MARILPTILATGLPADSTLEGIARNLAKGLAFLPSGTTIDNPQVPQFIGFDASEPDFGKDLLNLSIPLFLFRFRCSVNARFIAAAFIGYNFQYKIQGGLTANTSGGDLLVSEDASEGGMGVGVGWDLRFNFSLDTGTVGFSWTSGFRTTWEEVFNQVGLASIDMIGLAVTALRAAGFSIAMDALDNLRGIAGVGTFWGLHDKTSNQMARLGYLELKPKVALHGNLLDAVAAVSTKFKAFLKTLKKIGIKPAAGPVLNIYFPVRMRIVRIGTNFGNYDTRDPLPGGEQFLSFVLAKVDGPPVPNGNPVVQDLSGIHTHTIDIVVGLAIKFKIKLWSVFSYELSIPIDLTEFVPELRASSASGSAIGPYFNKLTPVGAADAAGVELPEVIWG